MNVYAGDTPWLVTSVESQRNYTLLITFTDGSSKDITCPPSREGRISTNEKSRFILAAHTDGCMVVWNGDLDIAPKELYENGTPIS